MCLTVHVYAYVPASEYLVLYVGVCHTLYWNTLIFTQNNVCLCCGRMLRAEKTPKDRKRTDKQQKQWMHIRPTKFFKILPLLLNIFHALVQETDNRESRQETWTMKRWPLHQDWCTKRSLFGMSLIVRVGSDLLYCGQMFSLQKICSTVKEGLKVPRQFAGEQSFRVTLA